MKLFVARSFSSATRLQRQEVRSRRHLQNSAPAVGGRRSARVCVRRANQMSHEISHANPARPAHSVGATCRVSNGFSVSEERKLAARRVPRLFHLAFAGW